MTFFPLQGLIPPMITPLTPAGDVDTTAVERHVNYLIDGGVNGLFVLGSSGEGPWLTAAQWAQVTASAVRAAAGRVPVLAGALEPSTLRTLEAIDVAAASGADAVVVTTPYYFASDGPVQQRHFETILDASPLPVMLYNIPPTTHNVLTPDTVRLILGHERLIGIKDSAGDWDAFTTLLGFRNDHSGFTVFQGAELLSGRSLLAGADGLVPGMGNVAPALFARLIRQARAGDGDGVAATQAQVEALWHLHTHGFWLSCLKYAVSLQGNCGPTTGGRPDLAESAQAAIRAIVGALPAALANGTSRSDAFSRST